MISEPTAPPEKIRLKAREFAPTSGVSEDLAGYFQRLAGEQWVHVLVQLSSPLTASDRQGLFERLNLRLLDPVPDGAFFAAMPPDLALATDFVRAGTAGRWIGAIEPADKVAPSLIGGEILPHVRSEGGGLELIVQFFGDVSPGRQEEILARHGAVVSTRIEATNGWQIELAEDSVMPLAAEDPVKWIEEAPPPAELDNDGVRSATGADADAVLAPSVYNLSGAGVVLAQWESTHASLTHADLAGRITLADPPLALWERSHAHTESVAANIQFDSGEDIYADMDDSGDVSAGDVRLTPAGGFPAGSTVAADGDVGVPLVLFNLLERFADTVTADSVYTPGEAVYLDNDDDYTVTAGDTRITAAGGFPAGSVVAAGDADVGQDLSEFPTKPHSHSTHVAGTVIGSGAQSAAQGGAANQWKGMAPGATLRSYRTPIPPVLQADYTDAAANGATVSTNSWGTSHVHQILPPSTGYDANSLFYDAVVSGRQSDGTPSGLAGRMLIVASAGNSGRPERHTENAPANGQFDNGESIYIDTDDDGKVSALDILKAGPAQPLGTPLVNFAMNEMHDETVSALGTYSPGEAIYLDADGSRTVTPGDTRITPPPGFPAGSLVAAGDADVGRNLRQFRLWGNVRIPNSAKNTVVVASIASDTNTPAPSTSRGPTPDGRLKPDMAGPGTQNSGDLGVTSTWPGNLYESISGTSMATPAVAGAAALLTERYQGACGPGPAPEVLRAILLHSAEDLTAIPLVGTGFTGPDYAHGYGRVQVKEAVDLVPHHVQATALDPGDTDYSVTIGAMERLKVTLVWDDPPWTANAAPSLATGMLHNDLDLLLIAPDGTQHTPWVLDPANPFAPATRSAIPGGSPVPEAARDRRNTVEQVVVDNAVPGTWTIRVTASTLNLPPQTYTLVSEVLPPQAGPCQAAPAADIWMRDNVADTGMVPSLGVMWLSPDVWNRLAPDGGSTHGDPEFGQVNYLYANLRNASPVTVHATSIDVWVALASTGLSWPDDFSYVGRFSVPNLGPTRCARWGPWNGTRPRPPPRTTTASTCGPPAPRTRSRSPRPETWTPTPGTATTSCGGTSTWSTWWPTRPRARTPPSSSATSTTSRPTWTWSSRSPRSSSRSERCCSGSRPNWRSGGWGRSGRSRACCPSGSTSWPDAPMRSAGGPGRASGGSTEGPSAGSRKNPETCPACPTGSRRRRYTSAGSGSPPDRPSPSR